MTGNKFLDSLLNNNRPQMSGDTYITYCGRELRVSQHYNYCVVHDIENDYTVEIMYNYDEHETKECLDKFARKSFQKNNHKFTVFARGIIRIAMAEFIIYPLVIPTMRSFKSKWVNLMHPEEFISKSISALKSIAEEYNSDNIEPFVESYNAIMGSHLVKNARN